MVLIASVPDLCILFSLINFISKGSPNLVSKESRYIRKARFLFADFGNNFDFGTRIEVKTTVSEYHNQNYCQKVLQSKGMRGSIKIEKNAREYHNQANCQEV